MTHTEIRPIRGCRTFGEHLAADQFARLIIDATSKFWANVKRGPVDDCWPWLGKLAGGYGTLSVGGATWGAHRLSYYLANGTLDRRLVIDHTCCNAACVNPEHLRQVDHATNSQSQVNHDRPLPRNVYLGGPAGKFRVFVKFSRRIHYGGTFDTIEAADSAASQLRGRLFSPDYEDRRRDG